MKTFISSPEQKAAGVAEERSQASDGASHADSRQGQALTQLAAVAGNSAQVRQLQLLGQRMNRGAQSNGAPTAQLVTWSQRSSGRRTDVDWQTDKVLDDTVGISMKAILGPEHAQGGPPKASAQKALMANLPTEKTLPADRKYIKGHLLNDHVGGPGEGYNLYPITAKANSEHERLIESKVKKWVNDERRWVKYQVGITTNKAEEADHNGLGIVNATLVADAKVIDSNDAPSGETATATIVSEYKGGDAKSAGGKQGANPDIASEDQSVSVLLSKRSKKSKAQVFDWIRGMIEYAAGHEEARSAISDELTRYKGIGEKTAESILTMEMDTEPTKQQITAFKRCVEIVGGLDSFNQIFEGALEEVEDDD
jgi:hypothetical protein